MTGPEHCVMKNFEAKMSSEQKLKSHEAWLLFIFSINSPSNKQLKDST